MSEVTSVNGKTGAVVLKAAEVEAVATSEVGQPSGVASLNGSGELPEAQLPSSVVTSSVVALGEVSGEVTPALGGQKAPVVTMTLTGNTVGKKPTGWASGPSTVVVVVTQNAEGGHKFSWEGITWMGKKPSPNIAANARSVYILESTDGGTHWYGVGLETGIPTSGLAIDLCAQYGAEPGEDITTKPHEAIEAVVTEGNGEIYFSVPGIYHVEGAVKEGEAQEYKYAGQVLFPAIAMTSPRVTVKIRGLLPSAHQWQGTEEEPVNGSVVLLTNATSGSMFDAIPSVKLVSSKNSFTNIKCVLKDIVLRAPNNPECGGLNAAALMELDTEDVKIDVNAAGTKVTEPTHTGTGLKTPRLGCGAHVHCHNTKVIGYPVNIDHSEHIVFDDVVSQHGGVGLEVNALEGHACTYTRVLVQNCPTTLLAPTGTGGGGTINGVLDVECEAGKVVSLVTDESDKLQGTLALLYGTAKEKGFPVIGGINLNLANLAIGGIGCQNSYPRDGFTRVKDIPNNLGVTDLSTHPWIIDKGKFTTSAGFARSEEAALLSVAYVPYYLRKNGTRTIEALIKTANKAGYNAQIIINRTFAGTDNYMAAKLSGGCASINKRVAGVSTELVKSEAGLIKENTSYTVEVVVSNPAEPEAPYTITVYINGKKACTYELTKEDKEHIAAAHWTGNTRKADGIGASSDNESTFTDFAVIPQ